MVEIIGKSIKESGTSIGNSLKGIRVEVIKDLKNRIRFLEEVLKYTNKSTLIRKHKRDLIYLKSQLNYLELSEKLIDYLADVEEFVKS